MCSSWCKMHEWEDTEKVTESETLTGEMCQTQPDVLINFYSEALQDVLKLAADGGKCDHDENTDVSCRGPAVLISIDDILNPTHLQEYWNETI